MNGADRAELARAFATFCDGLEEAGLVDYARRGRTVADELLMALEALEAERSARRSIHERHEMLLERLEVLHGAKALGAVWPSADPDEGVQP